MLQRRPEGREESSQIPIETMTTVVVRLFVGPVIVVTASIRIGMSVVVDSVFVLFLIPELAVVPVSVSVSVVIVFLIGGNDDSCLAVSLTHHGWGVDFDDTTVSFLVFMM
jgi:hypothetical protein